MLTAVQKADAANQKKAAEDSKRAAEEDKQWSKGSKSNAKKWVSSLYVTQFLRKKRH